MRDRQRITKQKTRLPQAYISNNRSIYRGKTKPTPHATGVKFLTKLINQRQIPTVESINQKSKLIVYFNVFTTQL